MKDDIGMMMGRAFSGMVESGKLEQMIQARIEGCVKSALDECTGYGSAFSKMLKEAVEKALERTIAKLVADEVLMPEQAERLIAADMKRSFRSDIPQRLVQICGTDTVRMAAVVDALGSTCVRYVKP
jgi:hypothetical protein